jgi:hypothetical protein
MPNNSLPEIVETYLKNLSLQKWKLEYSEQSGIEMIVVVPAIQEYENIKRLLKSLADNDKNYLEKTLVIFVVNNSTVSDSSIKNDNYKTLEFLRQIINNNTGDDFIKMICNSGMRIGIIDAATSGNEFDGNEAGVGLARKIGMDEALKVFDYSLPNKKIIIALDADCTVENNYLSTIYSSFNNRNLSAATIEFQHNLSEDEINKAAIISYEIFLRHYVTGLLFAGSPYAYHTIGSTIVCDHEAYIKCGGMNKKPAAEDFYFLQKLAKNYTIYRISSTHVKPSSRESWRVPFGTGRSMTDYNSNGKEILLYDPVEYLILKEWLILFNSDVALNTEYLLKEAKKIHSELYLFLEHKMFSKDWNNILENSKTGKQLMYQRKNWFDAFNTLKLIHHLRDTTFPMLNFKEGIEKLFRINDRTIPSVSNNEMNNTNVLKHYLSEMKNLENTLAKNPSINISIGTVI